MHAFHNHAWPVVFRHTIKMQNTCSRYQVLEKDEVRLWDSFAFRASMNTQDIILKELNFLCGKIFFFFVVTNYFR